MATSEATSPQAEAEVTITDPEISQHQANDESIQNDGGEGPVSAEDQPLHHLGLAVTPDLNEEESAESDSTEVVLDLGLNGVSDEVARERFMRAVYTAFQGDDREFLLPGQPITAQVEQIIKSRNLYLDYFTRYIIKVEHAGYEWIVRCSGRDLLRLHDDLVAAAKESKVMPPKFKSWLYLHYKEVKDTDGSGIRLIVNKYLRGLVESPELLNNPAVLQFLEVSRFSFVREIGSKYSEGLVDKKGGGLRARVGLLTIFRVLSTKKTWLVVKESFLMLVTPHVADIRAVLLFDSMFNVEIKHSVTNRKHELIVSNKYRRLRLKHDNSDLIQAWAEQLREVAAASSWANPHPNNSFAPQRPDAWARWFADGREHFTAVARAIERATEEIFIADWWLSPEVYLLRPPNKNEDYRLDRLLVKKAAQGVRVCIVVYKNVELAVGINSMYTKRRLQAMHPNISVQRHPDHPPDGVWLWAHHEKIVVVDQQVAFVGGLDLCFGRDDSRDHVLTDVYNEQEDVPEDDGKSTIYIKVLSVEELPFQAVPKPLIGSSSRDHFRAKISDVKSDMKKQIERVRGRRVSPTEHANDSTEYMEAPGPVPGPGPVPRRKESMADALMDAGAKAKENMAKLRQKLLERVDEDDDIKAAYLREARQGNDVVRQRPGASLDDFHSAAFQGGGGGGMMFMAPGPAHQPKTHALRKRHTMPTLREDRANRDTDSAPAPAALQRTRSEAFTRYRHFSDADMPVPGPAPQRAPVAPVGSSVSDNARKGKSMADVLGKVQRKMRPRDSAEQPSSVPTSASQGHIAAPHAQPARESATSDGRPMSQPANETATPGAPESDHDAAMPHKRQSMVTDARDRWQRLVRKLEASQAAARADSANASSGQAAPQDQEPSTSTPYETGVLAGAHEADHEGPGPQRRQSVVNDARDRWQWLVRKLEVSGGAEGAEGGDAGHRDKRKSMFLRRLATSARDKPDHVSDEEVSHAPATVDYTLTYADFTTPTYTTPYAAGKAKFSIAPHVLSVDSLQNTMTFAVRVQYEDGTMREVQGAFEVYELAEGSPTVVTVPLTFTDADGTSVLAGSLVMEYLFYKKERPAIKKFPTWVGKDYSNPCTRDFFELQNPEQDSIDRWTQPRMPWHDVSVGLYGQAARDVARHFIERWNHVKTVKAKRDARVPFLVPKVDRDDWPVTPAITAVAMPCNAQILRSVTLWSSGIATEASIHAGYLAAIRESEHYIYIENQFFVTSLPDDNVTNEIGNALFERIVRAHEKQQTFRVFVMMPLMPAFEGEFGPDAAALQVVMHWQFRSINRGSDSLLKRLEMAIPDWRPYISFACLRNYDTLFGKPVENQVYIHSKLIIVDDRLVICGSANINDRSLLGSRDSEIAVMVRDTEFKDSTMNGAPYRAGKFALSFRQRLWSEHLGISGAAAAQDPVVSEFWDGVWHARINNNTKIYEDVFRALPNNHVHTWGELEDWRAQEPLSQTNPEAALDMVKGIKGHIVSFPYDFLDQEYMGPKLGNKEAWVPMKTFT